MIRRLLVGPICVAVLCTALAGCTEPQEREPLPWEVSLTHATIGPGKWIQKSYDAEDGHVLSITTNLTEGPPVRLLTIPKSDQGAFESGEPVSAIQGCSHDTMNNSTMSCPQEAGGYVVILVNDSDTQPSTISYSIGGAWLPGYTH